MRQVMSTTAVAEHFGCTNRQAREYMRQIGIINIGHGYIYSDALEAYEARMVEQTEYTLPILQKDYPTKHPRYTRERKAR